MADLLCPLREACGISPHETALIAGENARIFPELDLMVSVAAQRLILAGIREGEHVALFLPQGEQSIVLYLAIIRAGAVACPLNTRWPRARVLEALRQIDAVAVIAYGKEQQAGGVRRMNPDELLQPGGEPLSWNGKLAMDRPCTIVFTSGSSGQPKPAVLTFGNQYYNARGANANIRVHTRDRWLLSLPLYHVGGIGIIFRCLMGGGTIVLPQTDGPVHEELEALAITHVSMVSTHLHRWLSTPSGFQRPERLKAILLGGGPIPVELVHRARSKGLPVYPSYGMTEMGSQVCTVPPDAPPARHATSGRVLRHRECRIADDGEIMLKGPALFSGYFGDRRVLDSRNSDGWFASGDLGYMTDDGYLVVTGRKDDQFISGGENIQPGEIERVLLAMEGVQSAVVVPVPDPEFGMRPVALLDPAPDGSRLVNELRARLPGYMIPIAFLALPDGTRERAKPDRTALAEFARAHLGR